MPIFSTFLRDLKRARKIAFLCSDGTNDSRWSILAWNPVRNISYDGKSTKVDGRKVKGSFKENFEALLKNRKKNYAGELPFIGGAIGAINYEYGYELLGVPYKHDGRNLIEFNFYDQGLVYDHQKDVICHFDSAMRSGEIPDMKTSRERDPSTLVGMTKNKLKLLPSWNFEKYQTKFDLLKENIRQGEIYQACLTFPFTGLPVDNTRNLFAQLWSQNPAPMGAYLEQSDRTILSLSPERFISWDGENIETKPIKGTRPRGTNEKEDEQFKQDLINNEKERAELNMITDLLRNDLAKVSKPGTVKVLKHQALQACPNVWHTYAHIKAKTKDHIQVWDIVETMFPGGSISGCPKKRAVEILSELEDAPRGIYTGCIGYISDHGRMDLNIAIRTLEQQANQLQASFGGGIVYDSVARREWKEVFDKAKLFL